MKIYLFAVCTVILLTGCTSWRLPEGQAPVGSIIDNSPDKTLNSYELEEHAATSLCAYILSENPVSFINCADDASQRLVQKITPVTGVMPNKKAPLRLCRKGSSFILLSENGRVIWQYPAQ